MEIFVYILIGIAVFLLCRELNCWYWKLNQIVSLLEEIKEKMGKSEPVYEQSGNNKPKPDLNNFLNNKPVDKQSNKEETLNNFLNNKPVGKQSNKEETDYNKWTCPKCGAENGGNWYYCSKCGKQREMP